MVRDQVDSSLRLGEVVTTDRDLGVINLWKDPKDVEKIKGAGLLKRI